MPRTFAARVKILPTMQVYIFTIQTIFGFQFKFQFIVNSIARLPFKEFDTTFIAMENYKI